MEDYPNTQIEKKLVKTKHQEQTTRSKKRRKEKELRQLNKDNITNNMTKGKAGLYRHLHTWAGGITRDR